MASISFIIGKNVKMWISNFVWGFVVIAMVFVENSVVFGQLSIFGCPASAAILSLWFPCLFSILYVYVSKKIMFHPKIFSSLTMYLFLSQQFFS